MFLFIREIEQQYINHLKNGGFPYHVIIIVLVIGGFFFGYFRMKWKEYQANKVVEGTKPSSTSLKDIFEANNVEKKRKKEENVVKETRLKADDEFAELIQQANKLAKEKAESERLVSQLKKDQQIITPNKQVANSLDVVKQEPTLANNVVKDIEPLIKTINESEEQVVIIESRYNPKSEVKHIGYKPHSYFSQGLDNVYPSVKMPPKGCKIKFPRKGRSNKVGYKEKSLFLSTKLELLDIYRVLNDRHIPTSSNSRPYEPDLVLINEKNGKNIFINIEIDEPYESYSRTPTHEIGADNKRDEFFTARGWIVIRFTEKQVHEQLNACVIFIKKVIASIDNDFHFDKSLNSKNDLKSELKWDNIQAKKWAKEFYREKYLGVKNFGTRPNIRYEYIISNSEMDLKVEKSVKKSPPIKKESEPKDNLSSINLEKRDSRIDFDAINHRYFIDGNEDTISVTELIDKFFPSFDSDYWSKRKAAERGVDQSVVLNEWETKRTAAAEAGTLLHKEIENYYNGLPFNSDLLEFQYFLAFVNRYKNIKPYRSEWRIFDDDLLIAGTVDMVFQKEGDELFMFDWKRSEKVVDENGKIKNSTWDFAFGELSHLGDSSYNKYALQQNIYKHILEKRYGKKISSMNLLILHPEFKTYHVVQLPEMTREVKYIFEAAKYYR